MYNRVDGEYTRREQADSLSRPADSSEFAQTLTEVARRESLPRDESVNRMGLCFSKPHTADAIDSSPSTSRHSTSSLSSSSELSSAASPVRDLFGYRTAELSEANVSGICVGLVAEWLISLPSSPSSRMRALLPGTENHSSAARRQGQYEQVVTLLKEDGAEGSHSLQAKSAMLRDAGLEASAEQTGYRFGTSSCIDEIVQEVTQDASRYWVRLNFVGGGAHSIATATSNGTTTLFDPNYGEFAVAPDRLGGLFKSLAERYSSPPNNRDIATVVTQRVT
ncbi:YopT-type cysteine protease domain-containing protein [Bradyrhizobium sp. CCBAU 45384]|uniref:YopT-type cysteine protease domain-containing protein n=1 Tax=Bradyrhizobium sp. CCBAU 45384 TaxID=858428 RepID=UPI002FE31C7D|nr:peptidase C58 [Bradyrhizobium sp. CCBAU 45384]